MVIRDSDPFGSHHIPTSSTPSSDRPDPSLHRAAREAEHQSNTIDQQWHNFVHNPQPRTGTGETVSLPYDSSDVAGLPSANPSASYWLQDSEESKRLENYRSTPSLPRTADTVIVGSGITGAFAAWFLLEGTGGAPLPRPETTTAAAAGQSSAGQQSSGNQQQQQQEPWERHIPPNWREGLEDVPFPSEFQSQPQSQTENSPSVLMLEARHPCSGATGRNGGHCQPLIYSSSPSTAEFELATYQFIKSFVEEHGISEGVDWRTLKSVHGYLTDDVWQGTKGLVEGLPKNLREKVDCVDETQRGEGGESLGDLRVPGVKGAVVQKHAASLWPYKLVAWVLERLLERYPVRKQGLVPGRERRGGGFNLQSNTAVLGLHKLPDGRWIVATSRGQIWANRVLLAMNGYTSNLLPKMQDLIVPVRSQVASLRPPKDTTTKRVAELEYSYAFVSEEKFPRDEYLIQRPLPGGELIYGGARSHAENKAVGVWQDDDVEREVAAYLRQNLALYPLDLSLDKTGAAPMGILPMDGNETTELKATYQWTGIMGFSRDASPWVGRVPESLGGGENLFVCAGYTGHGMPQAALAARMVVEEIMGKPVTDDGLELPKEMKLTEERARWVRENTKTLQEQQEAPGWSATMPELLAATERRG